MRRIVAGSGSGLLEVLLRTYLIKINARSNAVILECLCRESSNRPSRRKNPVIPECLCRESRKSHWRGFPTEAFGNDGICARHGLKANLPTDAFGNNGLVGLCSIYEIGAIRAPHGCHTIRIWERRPLTFASAQGFHCR